MSSNSNALLLALAVPSLFSAGCSTHSSETIDVDRSELVYGTDDRLEYGSVTGTKYRAWTDATAAVVDSSRVSCASGSCALSTTPWTVDPSSGVRLCQGVRFRGQPNLNSCSGFLVGPDLFVTAGHCTVSGTLPCESSSVVFGFVANDTGGDVPTSLPESNVYTCAQEIDQAFTPSDSSQPDWALWRLDRPVVGRAPLNVRRRAAVNGTDLVIIGYPYGIPAKISPTGEVTAVGTNKLSHNVESFSGNSGSAVFDELTGVVEAIHTNPPASHFTLSSDADGTCVTERVCPETGCPGFSLATELELVADQIPLVPAVVSAVTS